MVALSSITLMLRPDDRLSNELPSGSPAQLTMAHLDKSLGGLQTCTINIHWKEHEVNARQVATVIHAIDQTLDQEPLVGHPLSVGRVLAALPGDEPPIDKMPMADLLPPPLKLALYDPDQQTAKINFRVQDLGDSHLQACLPADRLIPHEDRGGQSWHYRFFGRRSYSTMEESVSNRFGPLDEFGNRFA